MIHIHHESSESVRLLGASGSYSQIADMIRGALQDGADSMTFVAEASRGDGGERAPALLRVRYVDTPINIKAIGQDLLIKGNSQGLLEFCAALEVVGRAEPGGQKKSASAVVDSGDSGVIRVSIELV